MPARLRRHGWCIFLVLFSALTLAAITVVVIGLNDDPQPCDLALVLGNKVNAGGQPSPMLKARLDQAAALFRDGYFREVLVSGGRGKEGYDEADVMARYLTAHGVPEQAILLDHAGNTTWATARNTAHLMAEHRFKSVLIVSQYFHLARCRLAFAKFGLRSVRTSHARFWSLRDFYSVPREVFACVDYALRRADSQPETKAF